MASWTTDYISHNRKSAVTVEQKHFDFSQRMTRVEIILYRYFESETKRSHLGMHD